MTGPTLYQEFETDEKRERDEGIHIEIPQTGSKFYFKRAGGANTAFTRFIEKENRKQRVGGRDITSEAAEPILAEGLARFCMIDWENVTDRKGKKLDFSIDNAIKLFTDLPSLMLIIYTQAASAENFLAAEKVVEEEAGN